MKPDPLKIRRGLARLPKVLQPLFTYITGLEPPPEYGVPKRRRPWRAATHLWSLLLVWLATLVLGVQLVSSVFQGTIPALA